MYARVQLHFITLSWVFLSQPTIPGASRALMIYWGRKIPDLRAQVRLEYCDPLGQHFWPMPLLTETVSINMNERHEIQKNIDMKRKTRLQTGIITLCLLIISIQWGTCLRWYALTGNNCFDRYIYCLLRWKTYLQINLHNYIWCWSTLGNQWWNTQLNFLQAINIWSQLKEIRL